MFFFKNNNKIIDAKLIRAILERLCYEENETYNFILTNNVIMSPSIFFRIQNLAKIMGYKTEQLVSIYGKMREIHQQIMYNREYKLELEDYGIKWDN